MPPWTLEMDRARVDGARDTLASRDNGGMETDGEGFLDRHLRENEGIRDPILDASPLSGEASARCRLALGLRAKSPPTCSS